MNKFVFAPAAAGLMAWMMSIAVSAAREAPVPLPFPEALQAMRDEAALKAPEADARVLATWRALDDAQRAQLLREVTPLLTNPPAGRRATVAAAAFAAVGKPALPAVVAAFSQEKPSPFATAALAGFGTNAIEAVVPLLSSPDGALRRRALGLLASASLVNTLPGPPPSLVGLLKAPDAETRRDAVRALLAYRGSAAPLRADLLALAAGDPDPAVRVFALRGLVFLPGPELTGVLAARLADPELSVRAEALESAAALGPAAAGAAGAVAERFADAAEDSYLRRLAASALARLGQPGAEALARGLSDPNEERAFLAAMNLGQTEPALCLAAVKPVLEGGGPSARRFAALALAKRGPGAAPAYESLVKAAGDADPAVRRNALEALGRLGNDRAVDLCAKSLKDADPGVARAAAGAIEMLVTNAAQAELLLAPYRKSVAWRPAPGPEKAFSLPAAERETYEIGGPLAGLRLPLFKGQHGEEPGYPGSIPELMAAGKTITDMSNTYNEWGPQGQAPELELYPGAVEHYRNYMFKYYGARSFFDRQSQLALWTAPALPGADTVKAEAYAEPVWYVPRHDQPRPTGKFREPVSVIRCTAKGPVFKLDLGERETGLYVVRVVGAVENKATRRFLEPLFLRFSVNDGLKGEVSRYRIRCGYVDQFYSIAEFYFHAVEKRRYTAELAVDEGSRVDLLVHNLVLDDALAGTVREPVKRGPVLAAVPQKVTFRSRLLAEERMAQDADLWRAQPPLNAQGSGGYWPTRGGRTGGDAQADVARFGMDGLTEEQLEERYGVWQGIGKGDLCLVNAQLGLRYTRAQYEAGLPLPDPYPFKDSGAGLYQPDPTNPARGQVWAPIADWVFLQRRAYGSPDLRPNADQWVKEGDSDAAREETVRLLRLAWQLPGMDIANSLAAASCIPAAYNRDIRCRRRETYADFLSHYPNYIQPVVAYDKLFTYIDGNEELAASVSRFVPWVKSSRDLVRLLDSYLLQTIAKRIMRYHYATGPTEAGDAALLQGNKGLTEPWVDWLFSRTFVYPLKPAGLQNLMVSGCDRSGAEYVGSAYYAQGEGASRTVKSTEKFLAAGILPPRYDLTRSDLYPKPLAHVYWHLGANVAGQEFLRVGDVTGADKPPGHLLQAVPSSAVNGWRWSRDPRFAWIIKNAGKRADWTEAEWAAIEAAAARVPRAPWLDQPSRQLYNWAGILETGFGHNDWRYRRAVYVRTGLGIGHQHGDSLDLQVVAHGLPMTMDGGQRNGYSVPSSSSTRVHNLVEVNGRGHYIQSWVSALADAEGARYMAIEAAPPPGAQSYGRQVALVDVDEGAGDAPLAATQQLCRTALPPAGATANSYVFDVVRVSGGTNHTYCFHGPVSDELVVNETGRRTVTPAKEGEAADPDQRYLAAFGGATDTWSAGDAPPLLSATWRYSRSSGTGSELSMAGSNFDPASPRKYTRLHLFDAAGLRVLQAAYNCHNNGYRLHNVFAQKRAASEGEPLETAFAALIEPYAGEPFITGRRTLAVADNEPDSARAVAVEVKTKNGHRDLLFADGRPDRARTIEGGFRAQGAFACYSADDRGLRLAALAGGTLLEGPGLRLKAREREWTAAVQSVDYLAKTAVIGAEWPAELAGRICEIGTSNRTTSYTLRRVDPKKGTSALVLDGGADYYQAVVESVDATSGVVVCAIKTALGLQRGLDRDFTASNETRTKAWRADYLDEGRWRLSGASVAAADFEPSRFLRVWEYGTGDTVRVKTDAAILRMDDGSYRVTGCTPLVLALEGTGLEQSADRAAWRPLEVRREGKWVEADVRPGSAGNPVYVRVRR